MARTSGWPWWLWGGGLGLGLMLRRAARRRRGARYDLGGRTVLITGASRGLGLVLARQLLRMGARVAICARDAEELARAEEDLRRYGGAPLALMCDVTSREQVDRLVHQVHQRFGPIDVLINNAGVIEVGPVEVMDLADYEEAMAVNFWGAVYTTLAVLPEMYQRRSGRILNIASIGGKISLPHLLPYCASKYALVGFSQGLRAELLHHGILVTTACPGLMRTGSPRHAFFKGQHRAEYAWFSISDSLPVLSMSAERAARRILAACAAGQAEVVLPLSARLLALLNGVAPGTAVGLVGLAARLLPRPGGIGGDRREGKDSESAMSPSVFTLLGDHAAAGNNQMP